MCLFDAHRPLRLTTWEVENRHADDSTNHTSRKPGQQRWMARSFRCWVALRISRTIRLVFSRLYEEDIESTTEVGCNLSI